MKPLRPSRLVSCLSAAALLAGALAGCSRDDPDRPATNTVVENDEIVAPPSPTPTPERPQLPAPDAAIQSNAMDELTEEPAAPDEQMMDDAAASGMTSRASREDPSPRETPAEVVEQK